MAAKSSRLERHCQRSRYSLSIYDQICHNNLRDWFAHNSMHEPGYKPPYKNVADSNSRFNNRAS
eukprot:5788343-Pleurochrysis_carterae.AAC.2